MAGPTGKKLEPVMNLTSPLAANGLRVFDYHQPSEITHSHEFHEMVLVRNGNGLHVSDDGSYPIRRGNVFLVLPGAAHTYEDVRNLDIVNILFEPEKLNLDLSDLTDTAGYYAFFAAGPQLQGRYRTSCPLSLTDNQLFAAEEIILEIELEQKRNRPGAMFFRRVAFMRLIGLICRAFSESGSQASEELGEISRIIRYFEKNYMKRILLEDLCPVCGKSVSSIVRLFRGALGRSPIEYLIDLRLEKAAAMLISTSDPVSSIAYAVGFDDSNYFSKMFRKRYSVSPRDYRKTATKSL